MGAAQTGIFAVASRTAPRKAAAYLAGISRLAEYGTVRRQFLTGTPPTGMTFEAARLCRPEALVEGEVVAAVPAR
ncbi:hypothetical protein [Streptomyces hawaiiensis]|uniref:Uncharacterized protein n=1 Tax=Streptomyces hawaiiensis TaxID=67305 RepID=A0A6G5RCX4_9ACTN|nr:hypothetical protein CEB94_12900 [Streptomyces hawaiiensis]